MKSVIIGGLVGGVLLFFWGVFSHTVLPLGEMGVEMLPEEEVLLGTMESVISEPAIYFFPGMSEDPSAEEMALWQQKYEAGPTGILVYRPTGFAPMTTQRIYQLVTDLIAVLLAAFLLSKIPGSYGKRVGLVTMLGLICWFTSVVPLWTWYVFPGSNILATLIDLAVGWLLVGLVICAIVKPARQERR